MLSLGCLGLIVSIWIEKGLGMVVGGLVPSTQGVVTEYLPTGPEVLITTGIYAAGALVLTVLYRVAIAERELAMQ